MLKTLRHVTNTITVIYLTKYPVLQLLIHVVPMSDSNYMGGGGVYDITYFRSIGHPTCFRFQKSGFKITLVVIAPGHVGVGGR